MSEQAQPDSPALHMNVILNSRSPGINNGLTYETHDTKLQPGTLVRVPLRNKTVEGMVLAIEAARKDEEFAAKEVKEILSSNPLLPAPHVRLVHWIAEHYYCSLRGALTPFLPSSPWRLAAPIVESTYRIIHEPERAGPKQQIVLDYLRAHENATRAELLQETGASSSVITSLLKNGILCEEKGAATYGEAPSRYALKESPPALTPLQQKAYEDISHSKKPSLLFGITGSGKTEVYAHLIADAAAQGKQSILLVPEILLTEHTVHRFATMFAPEQIAVLHSKLTPAAKRFEWMRIRGGKVALIIGSRSALFAPCPNLGIVIVDEEHEWTYKNEQTPRYHARETAEALCRFAGARLVLGSATPSLEAWARAKTNRYTLVRIPERYQQRPLPQVHVVDLASVNFGSLYPCSPTLLQAIELRLQKKEQVVLFLNRRGAASSVLCLQCRRRLTSPASQLPFTMHRTHDGTPYLLDHTAGVSAPLPAQCPSCGSAQLLPVGAGTQRIEDILARVFPQARVLRADSDVLKHPEDMRNLLEQMRSGKADILLGTQTVVKGLDLPGVTLAAVLIADLGLSLPHFRAGERVFQLLTQLTGRSGRAQPGEVIIQTFRPNAQEVVAAAEHRTEDYLNTELQLRTTLHYPPMTEMIRFVMKGNNVEARAKTLQRSLEASIAQKHSDAKTMTAPTLLGRGQEWHVLLRGHTLLNLLPGIPLDEVTVDIDPVDVV